MYGWNYTLKQWIVSISVQYLLSFGLIAGNGFNLEMHLSRYENSASPFVPLGLRGLGDAASQQQTATIESIGASAASTTTALLVSMGTIAGPVGIAISGIIAAGMAIASLFKGCGQTCVEATQIANQAGTIISQAFNAYMASPIHYVSMQSAFLQLFDSTMAAMDQACSDPSLGSAGQNCISDRQRGSCKWKVNTFGWQQSGTGWIYVPAGAAGSGNTCWDPYVGIRDPVAQDPTVVPDPTPASAITTVGDAASTILSNVTSGGISPMLLLGGVAILGFMAMSISTNRGRYR